MSTHLAWYVARAAGLVAWALAGAAVMWGLALSSRVAGRRPSPAWLADVHRFLGGLTVTFTVVHVTALLLDDYVSFTPVDVLVPLASSWRPGAVAWGVVALYLLLAVELTSLLRPRVPIRWWRAVHQASVPLFVAGTVHLLTAGTDAGSPWTRGAVLVAVAVVVYLLTVRLLTPRRRSRRRGSSGPSRAPTADTRQGPTTAGGRVDRLWPRPETVATLDVEYIGACLASARCDVDTGDPTTREGAP